MGLANYSCILRRISLPRRHSLGFVTLVENCKLLKTATARMRSTIDNLTKELFFLHQIADVNETNFMNVSEELASSAQAKEFTNPRVFHDLLKELFHIVTSRLLTPLTQQNADVALQYCKVWTLTKTYFIIFFFFPFHEWGVLFHLGIRNMYSKDK